MSQMVQVKEVEKFTVVLNFSEHFVRLRKVHTVEGKEVSPERVS